MDSRKGLGCKVHFLKVTVVWLPFPQGVTLRLMGEKLVIARIMHGGLIHRQGLLKVGDVVKEVNGEVVSSMQPVELQAMLVRE